MSKKNPFIGLTVRVRNDATTLKGAPHPCAGKTGKIISKTLGGQQYQVDFSEFEPLEKIGNFPMKDFIVLNDEKTSQNTELLKSTLPLASIVPSRTNRQHKYDELQELAESIKANGVIQPILVRPLPSARLHDTFENIETRHATHEIVAGERRWRAAKIAGLSEIPVLERRLDDDRALVLQLLENLQREDLNPLDEARGIQRLIEDHDYSHEQAAEVLRKGRTHIFEALRLLAICQEAQDAMREGTLNRSLALLVAQRPTQALQVEFTKRILTSGPDGTALSFRSAKELALRNYVTDLSIAPFDLDDAELCPKVGACNQCQKRTGASPELWDKASTDVCTDTACFADKKEAHYERLTIQAKARGQTVITGREAREIMPTEGAMPSGYILLDKPRKNPETGKTEAPLRQVLGQDVPNSKVVLIESPSGAMVEAMSVRTAGAALEAQNKVNPPESNKTATRAELEKEYRTRWRKTVFDAVLVAMDSVDESQLVRLPTSVAQHIIYALAIKLKKDVTAQIFGLSDEFQDSELLSKINSIASMNYAAQNRALILIAMVNDMDVDDGIPDERVLRLLEAAAITSVAVQAIQLQVQLDMKEEAAQRASKVPVKLVKPQISGNNKTRPIKQKTSKADAAASIAEALQKVDMHDTK